MLSNTKTLIFLVLYTGLSFLLGACQSKYDKQEAFVRGYAIVSQGEKYGMINEAGEEVIPLDFESVSYFVGDYAKVKVGNKFGFINKKGETIIKPKYDKIYGYNGDYAKVLLNGKYGLIDKNAQEIIAPEYDAVNYNIIGGYFEVANNGEVSKLDRDEVLSKGNKTVS